MTAPVVARVAHARIGGRWVTDAVVGLSATGMRLMPEDRAPRRIARIEGALLPPLTDAHVHLGLCDAARDQPTALGRVLDLGWAPSELPGLVAAVEAAHRGVEARFAGPFHAAVGGYPSDRAWAPPGSVVELATPSEAVRAVRAQLQAGAAAIKITLSGDDGPVLDDEALAVIVAEARAAGLPVVAHARGAGQVERAIAAGVDVLAHAPWTERLDDAVIREAAARQTWISTLAMHERDGDEGALARATDNLGRFAAAGGAVAYGTDLGNGLDRFDLDPAEVAALRRAGIDGSALVDALLAERLLPPGPMIGIVAADVVDDESLLANLHRARSLPYTWFDLEASA
ncbi:hydrolase [Agrococcus sp. TF02-05]|uniref:amidohydrolase family protein n=1 Tax=Agrococcus sp. TF02-05 TaxID=2815211 RepID=UPI001AA17E55|nr:hydrolase [Agrococcus sp. TF02-05]MBO1769821.1 hydrolase [Agrococcus sp. TF02-05]